MGCKVQWLYCKIFHVSTHQSHHHIGLSALTPSLLSPFQPFTFCESHHPIHPPQKSASNCMIWVVLTHDIIAVFSSIYIGFHAALGKRSSNMDNIPPPTYTKPAVIKPYAFPNTSVKAHPPIPWIEPALTASPISQTRQTTFSTESLEQLICLAAEVKPRAKPCGQVTKAWNRVLEQLQLEGHFKTSSVTIIQNKLSALIAWQEVRHCCP